jgi:hypothetical protein
MFSRASHWTGNGAATQHKSFELGVLPYLSLIEARLLVVPVLGFSSQLFISLIVSFIYSLYTAVFNQPISLVLVPVQSYFDS